MSTDLEMTKYFYEERGDPARYVKWEEVREKYPTVASTYDQMETARRVFEMVLQAEIRKEFNE